MGETKQHYIELLKGILDERQKHNPQYSLRSFARSLDLDPGELCRILSGKKPPSLNVASDIADKLQLSPETTERFFLSVLKEKNRRTLNRIYHYRQNRSELKQEK